MSPAQQRTRPAETSQTLDRGLRVLELLAADGSRTVTEIAATLGVARPIVYRLLTTLEQHGLVGRGPGGRVDLGLGVLRLSQRVQPLLRQAATPVLRELAERVGASAHLTLADGDEALAVAVVEPTWTDFHVAYRVGSRHRLDRGAAGRAILALRSGSTAVVHTDSELQQGACGLAAPVPVPGQALEASVGVVWLGSLPRGAAQAQVEAAVALAAEQVAAALATRLGTAGAVSG